MGWRVKAVVDRMLGVVPGGDELHFLMEQRLGALRVFETELDNKVDDWRVMIGHLRAAGVPVAGRRFLELGTGWYPAFPILLYLAGATRVDTLDIHAHLRGELTRMAVERIRAHLPLIARLADRDPTALAAQHAALQAALQRGATLEAASRGVIAYRAPSDPTSVTLADDSVDCVFSSSVLEHLPADVIERCFTESLRVVRPGGVVFHAIDCGDHYAYADRRIDRLHYLRYSDEEWARWNNGFLFQNRLRAVDFTSFASRAGFAIELDTGRPHPLRLNQLAAMPVHASFAARYTAEELAVTSCDFIARKPQRVAVVVPRVALAHLLSLTTRAPEPPAEPASEVILPPRRYPRAQSPTV